MLPEDLLLRSPPGDGASAAESRRLQSGEAYDDDRIEPGLIGAVLRAVAAMARFSKRQQAELDVALRRAGLALRPAQRAAALRYLSDTASVEDIIPLDDGGVLLSVTSAGMERAAR